MAHVFFFFQKRRFKKKSQKRAKKNKTKKRERPNRKKERRKIKQTAQRVHPSSFDCCLLRKNPSRLSSRHIISHALNVVTNHVCLIHDHRRRGESFHRRKIGRVQEKRDRVAEQERAIGTRAIGVFFSPRDLRPLDEAMIPCISFLERAFGKGFSLAGTRGKREWKRASRIRVKACRVSSRATGKTRVFVRVGAKKGPFARALRLFIALISKIRGREGTLEFQRDE